MQTITKQLSECVYTPKAALIAYENDANEHYVETREVLESGRFGPAKPVTHAFINALLSSFSKTIDQCPHGPIPSNLLYADTRSGIETYVWWSAPGKHHQTFFPNLNIEDGDYPFPGTVFIASKGRLSVFCFEGDRPDEKTPLLYGPFFNYYDGGGICLGSAFTSLQGRSSWKDYLEGFERLFWGSENSHLISNPMKGTNNVILALKEAKEKGFFDTTKLRKTEKTLGDILKSLK